MSCREVYYLVMKRVSVACLQGVENDEEGDGKGERVYALMTKGGPAVCYVHLFTLCMHFVCP